jgi:hypothetical protein
MMAGNYVLLPEYAMGDNGNARNTSLIQQPLQLYRFLLPIPVDFSRQPMVVQDSGFLKKLGSSETLIHPMPKP